MTSEQEILQLAEKLWGVRTLDQVALKLAEESGEVCGAVVKLEDGRASLVDLAEEAGDALFVLAQLAAKLGTTLQSLLASACVKNTVKLLKNPASDPQGSKNDPLSGSPDLQTVHPTPPMTPHQRRKANRAAQTDLSL